MTLALSLGDARRLALSAQGLLGPAPRRGTAVARVVDTVRRLGAVQLDTISVLARSHELVPFARLGPVGRDAVAAAFWGEPHHCVEYWSHAACVLPVEDWPWYAWRRRRGRDRYLTGSPDPAQGEVRARLADGPLTTEALGGARGGGPWWDWSPLKVAVEQLLDAGEVVCVERRGWRRVYDLAVRAIPAEVLKVEPADEVCHAHLLRSSARRLGVGTLADLADYPRLPLTAARAALEAAGLVRVEVESWRPEGFAAPGALDGDPPRGRCRTVLLSPFDSLVWDRRRTERLFGFVHRLEAYTPAAQREHGYFTMPLLTGGRLAGRVDPRRRDGVLIARQVSVDRGSEAAMAAALVEASSWVGCERVEVERVLPPGREAALRALLGRAQAPGRA